ncbi:MAG: aminotransferase class IV [Pseudomonadota bacterium]
MTSTVYLNGQWCPPGKALINVNDRGFLFADAVYEAAPAYQGRFLKLEQHMQRLATGLNSLRIDADVNLVEKLHHELLSRNQLNQSEWAMVYTQITRGVAPRGHAFPAEAVLPTVYLFAKPLIKPAFTRWLQGYTAVTYPDQRWLRADLKTTMLLGNVLAQQAAVDAGADDVIMTRDGLLLEGSHANLFVVKRGSLHTPALDARILPGVTRFVVLELAQQLGLEVVQTDIEEAALIDAEEIFLCGTTTEVRPLISVDGKPIGGGNVGPITLRLYEAFQRTVRALA